MSIFAFHSSKGPVRLYIRKGVRPIHVSSQLSMSKDLLDAQLTPDDNGYFTISGLPELVSVFKVEGCPGWTDTSPIVSYSHSTTSRNRRNSFVPCNLQRFITDQEKLIALRDRTTTRSMTRATLPSMIKHLLLQLLLRLQTKTMTFLSSLSMVISTIN